MIKATLKSMLSRKLRLVLPGLAVVLGVMSVAGSFVLTDTLDRLLKSMFSSAYVGIDVQVNAKPKAADNTGPGQAPGPVPASVVNTVEAVHGVKTAVGGVNGSVVGKNNKVLAGSIPSTGQNWIDNSASQVLREGHAPRTDTEVVIDGALAKAGKFAVGDQIGIITLQPKKMFTVVGIYGYSGNRDSISGEFSMGFAESTAQQLLVGEPGVYTAITVTAASGESQTALRDAVSAALGNGYQVKTGQELAKDQSDQASKFLSLFNYILLGFAGISLFVGVFLILNTFSIIVAQRTKELALLRAVGASRNQIISSVVLEAAVIGLVASVIGLTAGVGMGALLAYGAATLTSLRLDGVGVPGQPDRWMHPVYPDTGFPLPWRDQDWRQLDHERETIPGRTSGCRAGSLPYG